MMNPVGKSAAPTRQPASIGYVFLPPDVDRAAFVRSCHQTGTVSVLTTDSEVLHRVPVTRQALADITIPDDPQTPGTLVLLVGIPPTNRPVVSGTFLRPDEPHPAATEHGWSQLLTRAGRSAALHLGADQARAQMTVTGDADRPAVLGLRAAGPDGRIEAEATAAVAAVERTFLIEAGEAVNIRLGPHGDDAQPTTITLRYDDAGLQIADRHGNQWEMTKDHLRLTSAGGRVLDLTDTISLGSETSSAEPAVLGNQDKAWRQRLLAAIKAITVPTGTGPSGPPVNLAQFEALEQQLDRLLSQKTTLD